MRGPTPSAQNSDLAAIAFDVLTRVRERAPRVHCVTNAVAQSFTANVLLAAGAIPSMTISPAEVGEFVNRAQALLVNLGTFDRGRTDASEIAIETAKRQHLPWVLDPVFVDRSVPRAALARTLAARGPTAIRLNRAEFLALTELRGQPDFVRDHARKRGTVIALTSAVDLVTDGERTVDLENGSPLMAKVTAMGDALSALVAACLAVEPDAWLATASALMIFGVAGEVGARSAKGPGSFPAALIDTLHGLDRATLVATGEGAMRAADVSLYALVDPERAGGHELPALAAAVARGGATLIQLRDKSSSTRTMIERACAIKVVLAPVKVPLVINDRVDVAAAALADGVHVGQDDMAVADARRLLGSHAIVGLSVKTVAQAEAAPVDLLDYVGIGGVFATTSKDNPDPPIGPDGLRRIVAIFRRRAPRLPLCGIAGIDATNAARVVEAGADGVAVISALSLAPDPADAARELRAIVDHSRAERRRR